jgi:hypothetical protein
MLGILFVGGLVVSVKIGGGSNLHNMDAYLVLLLVWGGYLLSGRAAGEAGLTMRRAPSGLLALIILMPFIPLLMEGGPVKTYTRAAAESELAIIQQEIQAVHQSGGEVLFMWQRQLLTFNEIHGVELVPEYETIELMEMAMSRNTDYLSRYQNDMRQKRFVMIIANFTHDYPRDSQRPFPEENNVWAEYISRPLLENYQRKILLPAA